MADAAKAGLVASVCRSHSRTKSWFLTSAGGETLGTTKPMNMNATIAMGPTAAHLGVVNQMGVAVTSTLGPTAEVTWNHEEPLPLGSGRYLRPDAVLSVLAQIDRELVGGEWFIEADRGTESITTLVDKLANYITYHAYRATIPGDRTPTDLHWRTRFRSWPQILFVFDCNRAQARIERLAAWARDDRRLEKHWNKLRVSALSIEDLANLHTRTSLLGIPNLDRYPLIATAKQR